MSGTQQFDSGTTVLIEQGRITDEQHQSIDLTDSRMDALASAIENSKGDYGNNLSDWRSGVYRMDSNKLVFSGSSTTDRPSTS